MATGEERGVLALILDQLTGQTEKLGRVAEDVAVVRTKVETQETSHERLVERVDAISRDYVSRSTVWRWVSLAAVLASGATGSLIYAAITHNP